MNLETVAKAICRADQDLDDDYSWEVQFEDGRESYRNMARAARDAHFVLSEPHWNVKRKVLAGAVWEERASGTLQPMTVAEADAAMSALGFRRAEELTS